MKIQKEIEIVVSELRAIEAQLPPGTCRFGLNTDEETGLVSSMRLHLAYPNLDVNSWERAVDIYYWEYQGQLEIHFWSKGMPEPVICTRSDCDPERFLQWCTSFMPIIGVSSTPASR